LSSSRKIFFYLLVIVAMVVAGVAMQFLLAQSRNQTAVNAEQIYALQQVHADTQAISDDLYRGESSASQQFQTHQKVMEMRLRQFNQQSGLLKTEAERKAASNESVELNHTWFALSQLLTKLQSTSPQLLAQRESKNQLVVSSSEMLTQIDDLALALGRESRLKNSVSSALSYVDLMAEVSTIRASLDDLQSLVQQVGMLGVEPSNLSQNIVDTLKVIEKSIEILAKDSDRIVKSKLIELLEARDAFVAENGQWSENLPVLSEAFLTSNAIQQRSEDFSLQLKAKLRSAGESRQTNLLRLLAYSLPILGVLFLVIGGRRYIQSTSTHLSIAQSSAEMNADSIKQTEGLKQQLELVETQKDQLEADLEAQGQKMQAVASDADRYLSDLENFTSKLDTVESNAETVNRENENLKARLKESETNGERYRLDAMERLSELQSVKFDLDQLNKRSSILTESMQSIELNSEELERQNTDLTDKLRESEEAFEQYRFNDNETQDELESAREQISELSRKSSDLLSSLESVELRASELQSMNDDLVQDLQTAEEGVEKYQLNEAERSQELESLNTEFEKLSASSSDLTALLESAESRLTELKGVNDELTQNLQTAEGEIDKYQTDASTYSEELVVLNKDIEQLTADSSEAQSMLEAKISDYDSLKKEKLQLDFELEAQQQEFSELLLQLGGIEENLSQRLDPDSESTAALVGKINAVLDVFSKHIHEVSSLTSKVGNASSEVQELYIASAAHAATLSESLNGIEDLQTKSGHLIESLNKLSLGGKASAEIVSETSAMAMQGVGSMQVINDSLESTASTIDDMLPSLERLTENSQLMKSVVELLDSISEQAQSLDAAGNRTGLDITANDDAVNSKYDLFENFRMATSKMTDLISEVLSDVEGLANSIQAGMNDVQDSSVHAIAMAKLMKQVSVSQSQLNRLVRALLTQTDLQTDVVRDFSDQLDDMSSIDQEVGDKKLNKKSIDQLIELCDELQNIAAKV